MMKTTTTIDFPKGTPEALLDLDSWLREFDRVVAHISGNSGMIPEDRIAHLLGCWGPETDMGENMRMDSRVPSTWSTSVWAMGRPVGASCSAG